MAQTGRVRIRMINANGSMVATAEASLLGGDSKPVRTGDANELGEIAFTDLPFGDSRFSVVAPGFNTKPLTVTIKNSDEIGVEIGLEVGSVGGPMLVETESAKMSSTLPATTKPAKRWRWLIFRR
jgi:hypothetical protein